MLSCILRAAFIQRNHEAQTLGEMLRQEGEVMCASGCDKPALDDDDLGYTREVLEPYLTRTDQPTVITALFGDEAARQLGYPPLGLSSRAGLALALHDARSGVNSVS